MNNKSIVEIVVLILAVLVLAHFSGRMMHGITLIQMIGTFLAFGCYDILKYLYKKYK